MPHLTCRRTSPLSSWWCASSYMSWHPVVWRPVCILSPNTQFSLSLHGNDQWFSFDQANQTCPRVPRNVPKASEHLSNSQEGFNKISYPLASRFFLKAHFHLVSAPANLKWSRSLSECRPAVWGDLSCSWMPSAYFTFTTTHSFTLFSLRHSPVFLSGGSCLLGCHLHTFPTTHFYLRHSLGMGLGMPYNLYYKGPVFFDAICILYFPHHTLFYTI